MPTPISKTGQADLRRATTEMIRLTRNTRRTIPVNDLLLLYWDQYTIDMVNTVRSIVLPFQLDAHSPNIHKTITVQHSAFPAPFNVSVMFSLDQPSSTRATLWPQELIARSDCDASTLAMLDGMLNELAADGVERGLFNDVCEFLIDESPSYEAACYMFPAFTSIMRRAGMRQLANECEGDVKRPPKLPVASHLMRNKIRHVNEWFAVQELLGTWESIKQARPDNTVEVTLHGNTLCQIRHEDETFTVSIV